MRDLITFSHSPTVQKAIANDQPLALLPQQLASSIEPRVKEWIDPSYGYDCEVAGYNLPATISTDQATGLLRQLETMLPLPDIGLIASELSRVHAMTGGRKREDGDAELTIAAFADEFSEYPAQMVVEALRAWPRQSQWFPTAKDIHDLIRGKHKRTLALLEALRERATPLEPMPPEIVDLSRGMAAGLRMERK